MKIKEVCKRTELTERTVRYYIEEGLIQPKSTLHNGREHRDYSETDIENLQTIAGLRKLFFTIDEIKDMQNNPERIAQVLSAYKLKMATNAKAKASIVAALDMIDHHELRHIHSVASKLIAISGKLPLPQRDINPNIGQFETDSKENREREYGKFLERQERQFKRGKWIIITIASLNILFALLTLIVAGDIIKLIIQVALSACLFWGVTWVRYLFAAGAALSFIVAIQFVFYSAMAGDGMFFLIFFCQTIYGAIACYLLFKSDAVSEFLYAQKNG
ncbi:MerR family transcriptional regulator [Paenibacillus sp. GSMTC-2017]|uniref:MerR family transcriptional regulator n=1 Tax=Paenibacillus sp. GSMTC-2017 TaxID=2794350 RepID=UPI0018D5C24F|nr:MerR family transcriptional regulator [Paenibacillus sp. GSMTC-2017]